jgi:hypothetical protein
MLNYGQLLGVLAERSQFLQGTTQYLGVLRRLSMRGIAIAFDSLRLPWIGVAGRQIGQQVYFV